MVSLALRSADGATGEGVCHLVEPPGDEPQLKPPQGAGCLSHAGQGVVIVPILPKVNEPKAIGVHTQVACAPATAVFTVASRAAGSALKGGRAPAGSPRAAITSCCASIRTTPMPARLPPASVVLEPSHQARNHPFGARCA